MGKNCGAPKGTVQTNGWLWRSTCTRGIQSSLVSQIHIHRALFEPSTEVESVSRPTAVVGRLVVCSKWARIEIENRKCFAAGTPIVDQRHWIPSCCRFIFFGVCSSFLNLVFSLFVFRSKCRVQSDSVRTLQKYISFMCIC